MTVGIIWFRNDLRLTENRAFLELAKVCDQIVPIYILDESTKNPWPIGGAQRWWLHHSLTSLAETLSDKKLQLVLRRGDAKKIIQEVVEECGAEYVFWNRVYEPYATARDTEIKDQLKKTDVNVESFNSSLLIEPKNILNKQGEPFKVFTPFWKHCLTQINVQSHEGASETFKKAPEVQSEKLDDFELLPKLNWADEFSDRWQPGESGAHKKLEQFIDERIQDYAKGRDVPSLYCTSELSPHCHFGEISPHQIWMAIDDAAMREKINQKNVDRFFSELGWREFSYYLLYHFPELPRKNFREKFDAFPWKKNKSQLKKWQQGQTGYPIVDAGMRELWKTGYMHNRVRMIVASFLIKDLLIDWREGEKWFWDTLVDADLASNSASWQWVAGSGADAAPYFRVFNPTLQGKKFDPDGEYVKRWVPELVDVPTKFIHEPWLFEGSTDYPKPIVDHAEARKKALEIFKTL